MGIDRRRVRFLLAGLAALHALMAAGCGGSDESADTTAATTESAPAEQATTEAASLSGKIEVDGSSTVGPLVSAAAERFQADNPDVQVTVGISGTGGGFERFCVGETDISNASRPIKDDEPSEDPPA